MKTRSVAGLTGLFACAVVIGATAPVEARYTGSGPACVSGVKIGDRLSVRLRPSASSPRIGWLGRKSCGFNIEAVEGRWTYIRGSDYRGRNIQGFVANRFLRARRTNNGGGDAGGSGYRGTGPACVTGVARGDRLAVRRRPSSSSSRIGWLGRKSCGFNIEAVEGRWTYIRGSDYRGRNIQGFVANRFLRARRGAGVGVGNDIFPVVAATGGGIVRRGPGTSFGKIVSLGEFERITVVENTGVMFNGYPWFKIRFRGGRRGFQWGGIICSEAVPFSGTFDTCDNFRRSLNRNNTNSGNAPQRREVAYSCNEGIPLIVTFIEESGESYALYSHDSGPKNRVAARPSGSGFRYSNGYHELRGQGRFIDLIEGGQVLDSCRAN